MFECMRRFCPHDQGYTRGKISEADFSDWPKVVASGTAEAHEIREIQASRVRSLCILPRVQSISQTDMPYFHIIEQNPRPLEWKSANHGSSRHLTSCLAACETQNEEILR